MAGPTVTLTFAGDADQLERTMDSVGDSSARMADSVGESSERIADSGAGVDELADRAGTAESRFTGLADSITSVDDISAALAEGSIGGLAAGLATMAAGMAEFVIPVLGTLITTLRVGLVSAMSFVAAHPLVFALLALVGIFVLLWTSSETFREIVMAVFNAVADFIRTVFTAAIDWIVNTFGGLIDWFAALPGRIHGFFMSIGQGIVNAFKWAFNFVADLWNNTLGSLQFTIPSWVPIIGGGSFGLPRMPRMHAGGVFGGEQGAEGLAILRAGERVTPPGPAGAAGAQVTFRGNTSDALATVIMHLIRIGKIQIDPAA